MVLFLYTLSRSVHTVFAGYTGGLASSICFQVILSLIDHTFPFAELSLFVFRVILAENECVVAVFADIANHLGVTGRIDDFREKSMGRVRKIGKEVMKICVD
jgi:hypothetical protein